MWGSDCRECRDSLSHSVVNNHVSCIETTHAVTNDVDLWTSRNRDNGIDAFAQLFSSFVC